MRKILSVMFFSTYRLWFGYFFTIITFLHTLPRLLLYNYIHTHILYVCYHTIQYTWFNTYYQNNKLIFLCVYYTCYACINTLCIYIESLYIKYIKVTLNFHSSAFLNRNNYKGKIFCFSSYIFHGYFSSNLQRNVDCFSTWNSALLLI